MSLIVYGCEWLWNEILFKKLSSQSLVMDSLKRNTLK